MRVRAHRAVSILEWAVARMSHQVGSDLRGCLVAPGVRAVVAEPTANSAQSSIWTWVVGRARVVAVEPLSWPSAPNVQASEEAEVSPAGVAAILDSDDPVEVRDRVIITGRSGLATVWPVAHECEPSSFWGLDGARGENDETPYGGEDPLYLARPVPHGWTACAELALAADDRAACLSAGELAGASDFIGLVGGRHFHIGRHAVVEPPGERCDDRRCVRPRNLALVLFLAVWRSWSRGCSNSGGGARRPANSGRVAQVESGLSGFGRIRDEIALMPRCRDWVMSRLSDTGLDPGCAHSLRVPPDGQEQRRVSPGASSVAEAALGAVKEPPGRVPISIPSHRGPSATRRVGRRAGAPEGRPDRMSRPSGVYPEACTWESTQASSCGHWQCSGCVERRCEGKPARPAFNYSDAGLGRWNSRRDWGRARSCEAERLSVRSGLTASGVWIECCLQRFQEHGFERVRPQRERLSVRCDGGTPVFCRAGTVGIRRSSRTDFGGSGRRWTACRRSKCGWPRSTVSKQKVDGWSGPRGSSARRTLSVAGHRSTRGGIGTRRGSRSLSAAHSVHGDWVRRGRRHSKGVGCSDDSVDLHRRERRMGFLGGRLPPRPRSGGTRHAPVGGGSGVAVSEESSRSGTVATQTVGLVVQSRGCIPTEGGAVNVGSLTSRASRADATRSTTARWRRHEASGLQSLSHAVAQAGNAGEPLPSSGGLGCHASLVGGAGRNGSSVSQRGEDFRIPRPPLAFFRLNMLGSLSRCPRENLPACLPAFLPISTAKVSCGLVGI